MNYSLSNDFLPSEARSTISDFLGTESQNVIKGVSKTFAGKTILLPAKTGRDFTQKLQVEDVRAHLNRKIAEVMKTIATDFEKRCYFQKDGRLLSNGIFYPRQYCNALKKMKKHGRLDFLLKSNSFHNGYLNSKYFTPIKDPNSLTGIKPVSFILKEKADPVEALKSIRKTLSLIGCGEVCQLAQYEAVLYIIGPKKFKHLFGTSSTPLMLGSSIAKNPIGRLRTYFMEEHPKASLFRKGDLVYFQNADMYFDKHPQGAFSGFNSICISDSSEEPKFTALGISPQGLTHSKIKDELRDACNDAFTYLECYSDELKNAYLKKESRKMHISNAYAKIEISDEQFEEQNGGKATLVCELDAEKITLLANTPIEKVRTVFENFTAKKGERSEKKLRRI